MTKKELFDHLIEEMTTFVEMYVEECDHEGTTEISTFNDFVDWTYENQIVSDDDHDVYVVDTTTQGE